MNMDNILNFINPFSPSVAVSPPVGPTGSDQAYLAFRWDNFTDLAKWGISITALVYASLSIKYFDQIKDKHPCAEHVELKNYYIPFVCCVIILFSLSIIHPYRLALLFEFIIKWLVPPTLLALSAYLVFLTNQMAHFTHMQVVQ